jgi:Mrp family chromosome partitioning ATPase
VHKAARGGASTPASSFASLERSLDRTIEFLTRGEATPEAKALLIEAKRLRSVVANWRSIPPAPDVHDEMLDRALALSTQAGVLLQEASGGDLKTEVDPIGFPGDNPPSSRSGGDTEVYALDFEPRLYALESSPESRPAAPVAAGRRARSEAPPPGYSSYPPPDEAPYAPYPAETAAYPSYPPQRGAYPSAAPPTYAPTASYPPTRESYPPPPQLTYPQQTPRSSFPPPPPPPHEVSTGRRAPATSGSDAPREIEPPVNDAPIAPETALDVHPIKLPEKPDVGLVLLSDAYSDRADTYRALRRKLASSGNPRVIAITSPGTGEGKTTCAINLALAIRESARGKVLLVEANVRAPGIAKRLGFDPPECFNEQIRRHREDPRLPWVAVEPLPQLHIMAVDARVQHRPLIEPVAFANGMERLKRAGYEYIIVDTPPVIGSFEVNMIADAVDGVIFTAITMKSKKSQVRKAMEQIMPAPILGAVVLDL